MNMMSVFFWLSLYHFKSDFWPISLYISPPNFAYPLLTDICSLGLRESQKAYTFWSPGGAKVFIISISFLESRKPSFPPCSEICKKSAIIGEGEKIIKNGKLYKYYIKKKKFLNELFLTEMMLPKIFGHFLMIF